MREVGVAHNAHDRSAHSLLRRRSRKITRRVRAKTGVAHLLRSPRPAHSQCSRLMVIARSLQAWTSTFGSTCNRPAFVRIKTHGVSRIVATFFAMCRGWRTRGMHGASQHYRPLLLRSFSHMAVSDRAHALRDPAFRTSLAQPPHSAPKCASFEAHHHNVTISAFSLQPLWFLITRCRGAPSSASVRSA